MAFKSRAPEEREAAEALLREGKLSRREIGLRLNIPLGTIHKWAQQLEKNEPQAVHVQPPPIGQEAPSFDGMRQEDVPPQPPEDGRRYTPPDDTLNYDALREYIASFYRLGGQLAGRTDVALAQAIETHADKAGDAWVRWIRSEPRIATLLQRMMIGTPLGEVIGVHVSLVIGYVLARNAARTIEHEADAAAAAAAGAGGEPQQPAEPVAAPVAA